MPIEELERRQFMTRARNMLLKRMGGSQGGGYMGGPTGGQFGISSSRSFSAGESGAFEEKKKNRALYGKYGKGGLERERLKQKQKEDLAKKARETWQDSIKQREIEEKERMGKWKRGGGEWGVGDSPTGGGGTVPGQKPGQPKTYTGTPYTSPAQQAPAPTTPSPFPGTREEQPWSQMPKGSGRITVPEESGGKPNMFGRKIAPAGTYGMNREGGIRFTPPSQQTEIKTETRPKTVTETTTTPTSTKSQAEKVKKKRKGLGSTTKTKTTTTTPTKKSTFFAGPKNKPDKATIGEAFTDILKKPKALEKFVREWLLKNRPNQAGM